MTIRALKTALVASTLALAGCFVPVPVHERAYGPPAVVYERPYTRWDGNGPRHQRRYVIEHERDARYDRDRRGDDHHRDWDDD